MSYYIYLDSNNKEIKREERGRGKSKNGSEKREDGNFYIIQKSINIEENVNKDVKVDTKPITECSVTPLEGSINDSNLKEVPEVVKTVESLLEAPSEVIIGGTKSRKTTAKKQLSLEAFKGMISYSAGKFHDEVDGFKVIRPDIIWVYWDIDGRRIDAENRIIEDGKKGAISKPIDPEDYGFHSAAFHSSFSQFCYFKSTNELHIWNVTDRHNPDLIISGLIKV